MNITYLLHSTLGDFRLRDPGVLLLLLLMILLVIPAWPYSKTWGWHPVMVALLIVVLLVLLF